MMIQVLFRGNKELQEVPDYVLGELIARGRIEGFRRSSGWVVIGRDPVREPGRYQYYGPERRKIRMRVCLSCSEMTGGTCMSSTCPDRYRQTKFFTFGNTCT